MHQFYQDNYQFCPKCKTKLNLATESLSCPNCQFTIYDNPALAIILLFHQQGKVLLAKRKYKPRANTWDSPGGFVQTNETAIEAAKREAKEELGVEIEIIDYLGSLTGQYEQTPVLDLIFLAKLKNKKLKAQDDVSQLKWFDLKDLPKNFAFHRTKQAINKLKNYLKG